MITSDIWFAAFVYKHFPKKLRGTSKNNNKTVFEFDLNQNEWDALKVNFIHSEESDIKYRIEKLKDLAFQ